LKIIDPNNPIPKYLQISAWLRESIHVGRYKTYERLPSEIELSQMCHVNRNTLRQAIGELSSEGLVRKVKGLGTFVSSSGSIALRHKLNRISSFSRELHGAGKKEKTLVLEKGYEKPSSNITRRLALGLESPVIAIRRLRTGDDIPLIYEETYLPEDLFRGILDMDLTGSMYQIFTNTFNIELTRCEQTIRAVNMKKSVASLFGLKEHAAALYLESVTYNNRNMPVEVLCCYFRGDKTTFEVELGRYHLTHQC
jgi:GntR family transcriptional regulator